MTKPTRLLWTPAIAFWWRDVIRFLRQRNRIIGALATPLVFWLLVGSGFGPLPFPMPEATLPTFSRAPLC